MTNLFHHVHKVLQTDTYIQAVNKIKEGVRGRTNKNVQRKMLPTNFPQGSKSF